MMGSVRVGGKIIRYSAGDVLAFPQHQGDAILSGAVVGADGLMFVSKEGEIPTPSLETPQINTVESSPTPEPEVEPEPEQNIEPETSESTSDFPFTEDSHWREVRDYVLDMENSGEINLEILHQIQNMFPTYDSVQKEIERILESYSE